MNNKRPAFTLIEMLVAMALTLFIMVIISQAFVTALETFSGLKGIGDLQGGLRTASSLLQSDLAQDHFEAKRKLSDPNLSTDAMREGFFHIRLAPKGNEGTDADGMPSHRSPTVFNGNVVGDALYFTIKLRGNRRENFLSHRLPSNPTPPPDFNKSPLVSLTNPPNFFAQPPDAVFQDQALTYNSQWAEVAWYLVRTGSTDEPANPTSTLGTPIYALYRAQYLLVPNNAAINANNNNPDPTIKETTKSIYMTSAYGGVSCFPNPNLAAPDQYVHLYFNSPTDVVNTIQRTLASRPTWWYPPNPPANPPRENLLTIVPATNPVKYTITTVPMQNSSLVLSNVVSFHVRILVIGASDFIDYSAYPPTVQPNQATTPSLPLPTTAATATKLSWPPQYKEFDTNVPVTGVTGIRALQIMIRAWDPNSQQTRQITIVQDM